MKVRKVSAFSLLKNISRDKRNAIGLLSLGTFMEYFDLMLFVHLSVLIERELFPENGGRVAALFASMAYCATFVFRPLGALFFGWLGDVLGRRSTVLITTLLMGGTCLVMATLPTSQSTNMLTVWTVLVCRVIQGIASLGEIMGASIYITEITKPPVRHVGVALMTLGAGLGGFSALAVGAFIAHRGLDWRWGFFVGASIAIAGSAARTVLRETPEFLQGQAERETNSVTASVDEGRGFFLSLKKFHWKTHLAYLGMSCPGPFMFFLVYLFFSPALKRLGYMAEETIFHNLIVSGFEISILFYIILLCARVNPVKILKFRGVGGAIVMGIWLVFFPELSSVGGIFLLQGLLVLCDLTTFPADAIFIKAFPVRSRFRSVAVLFALSRAVVHVIGSVGLVYLTGWFGMRGILLVAVPFVMAFFWGLRHFEKMEKIKEREMKSNNEDDLRLAA